MDTTVATKPPFGSVEHYAVMIRENAAHRPDGALREALIMASVLGPIQSLMRETCTDSDSIKVERIRNIFAAEALVRAELGAAA